MLSDPVLWTLVTIQLALGCFDVLFHHEFTERLPWRRTAAHELRLHAARNLFYGVLFVVFAWSEPHGGLAAIAGVLLVGEVLITLWDFVEEDLSRKLPATERVTHTLLAINYGAILAYLLPALVAWWGEPTGFSSVDYGWGSVVLSVAAVGVMVFAVRDFLASNRVRRLGTVPAAALAGQLERRHRVVVTGGTGFVGERLVNALSDAGHAVIVLTRDPAKTGRLHPPFTTVTSLDQIPKHLPIDAVVHLAGEPLANGLWTRRKRARILSSRLGISRQIARFIRRLENPPAVLIGASGIGFYGLRGDEVLNDEAEGQPCFSHLLTRAAEAANRDATGEIARCLNLRIGLVLGHEGGILARLLPVFDWGLGGPIGNGRQWMSWIERDDLVRLIIHGIATPTLEGPVNAVAPEPVRNRDFARNLGRALKRPALLPLPAFIVRALLGEMGRELLLSGQNVVPVKILESGFRFQYSRIDDALGYCVGTTGDADTGTGEAHVHDLTVRHEVLLR